MTEIQLKKTLRNLKAAKIRYLLLEECLQGSKCKNEVSQYKESFKIRVMEQTLNILNRYEKFVIEMHLVEQYTWIETVKLFSEKYGMEEERSERTLKRIQQKGLKKMVDFINDSTLNECFCEEQ